MNKPRKRATARRNSAPATKRNLILLGVAAAAVGTYLFAGDAIKKLLKLDGPDFIEDKTPVQLPSVTPKNGTPTPSAQPAAKPEPPGIDINRKLRKGINSGEVTRLQFIINYIAGLRKATSYKTPGGYTVNFPIKSDGDFGNNTQAGAYFIAPSFKDNGYITLDEARKRLAYIAGYYDKPFPSELVGTKNFKEYQTSYKSGEIDGNKNSNLNLPNVGLNLVNFPTPFN
jgi:hypothetical protein